MTMFRKSLAALLIGCGSAATVQAASVYLTPSKKTFLPFTTTATLDLVMDFGAAESTVGGGIDIGVTGAGSFTSFAPSPYLQQLLATEPAFNGSGTAHADRAYEVHFGSFNGLNGTNTIGTFTFGLTGVPGSTTTVSLATNQFWGGFFSATTAAPINVALTGATITVLPEPQAVLLLFAGLGVLGVVSRRRLQAA